jgi:GDPmannose 4,6-dehydratase
MDKRMQKALIFGASGQDGIYLTELCRNKQIEPITVARSKGFQHEGSVVDRNLVEHLVKQKPDFIFHLAANSTTRHEAIFENHETISTGSLNILESVKKYSPTSRVLIVGSGVQFKNTGEAISEKNDFEASNAYAIARIQSVYAARYFRGLGIKTYVAYLFHHESPYRQATHISKMITSKIRGILAGETEKITIGDASVQKEWAYAKDIVEGIFTLVSQEQVFEATIGTGVAHSIMDFLTECFAQANLPLEEHVSFMNNFTPEYSRLVSDPETINGLGWKAKTDLKSLVKILLS